MLKAYIIRTMGYGTVYYPDSDRIPENYLALSVRRGDADYDVIKARYPREVVEKMLELGSSIVASSPAGDTPSRPST